MSYLKAKNPCVIRTYTLREIIDMALSNRLNLSPAYQRGYIASESWRREFIGSIFRNASNSTLHMRNLPDSRKEAIDGVQRISTIVNFYLGSIKTPLYHSEPLPIYLGSEKSVIFLKPSTMKDIQSMTDSEILLNRFLNYKIGVVEYDASMTDDEAAEVFWSLNDNNDLKNQEKINGILGVVSEWVREVARIGNLYPKLKVFDVVGVKPDGRMNHDEIVAQACLYESWHQTKKEAGIYFGTNDDAALKDFYKSETYRYNKEAFEPIAKEVERRFEIVRKICIGSGKPNLHSKKEGKVLLLYTLTYALEEKFGKNVKIDYQKFSQKLWVVLSELADSKFMKTFPDKTRFTLLMGKYMPREVKEKMALILGALEYYGNPGITMRDSRRVFSVDEKYRRWIDQDRCCALTGEEIKFDEAEGGHIVPHSKGGKTTYDNLVILSKKANKDMDNVPFYEFKEKYLQSL